MLDAPIKEKDIVIWKDMLDNKWYGPDPVIMRSRGAVCVFPQGQETPHWVPTRLTRSVEEATGHTEEEPDPLGDDPAVSDGMAAGTGGSETENSVCLPETHACSP